MHSLGCVVQDVDVNSRIVTVGAVSHRSRTVQAEQHAKQQATDACLPFGHLAVQRSALDRLQCKLQSACFQREKQPVTPGVEIILTINMRNFGLANSVSGERRDAFSSAFSSTATFGSPHYPFLLFATCLVVYSSYHIALMHALHVMVLKIQGASGCEPSQTPFVTARAHASHRAV